MKQQKSLARSRRGIFFFGLIFFLFLAAAARAQVSPTVCVIPNPRSGTTTLVENISDLNHSAQFRLDTQSGALPSHLRAVINPGGANEETIEWATSNTPGYYLARKVESGVTRLFTYTHNAGETVKWSSDLTVVWGYKNTSSASVSIGRGISTYNFFTPGPVSYLEQPSQFLPGIHTAFSFDFPATDNLEITWVLDDGVAMASKNSPVCTTITYQGRLTDAGAAANGLYDLRFTVYNTLTGGAAQGDPITVENAQVTNGVFTVQLNFASAFYNNPNAQYMQIEVRPGASSGNDPFNVLTPRQPITSVPQAVNAQTARKAFDVQMLLTTGAPPSGECYWMWQNGQTRVDATNNRLYICTATGWKSVSLVSDATNNTNFIQNTTTQQTNSNFNISGNGTVGGNLTVNGTLNATLPTGSANYIQNTTTPQNASINITGTITSGCRSGFTAFAGGRLCVSEMKPADYFLVGIQTCANDSTRVGNSGDVMLTLGASTNFNYFGGLSQGWLADNLGNNQWGTWKISFANADFAGAPANGTAAGPKLPYRCVY